MPGGYGHKGKYTNAHEDTIGGQVQSRLERMFGEIPGEVLEFDPVKQTAKVRPLYKMRLDNEPTQLPDLEDVPVRFPRSGGFVWTTPIKAGDRVTLRPMMRNSEAFHEEDGAYAAGDARSSSLSDMEAHLAGGEGLSRPIPNFNNQNSEWRSEDGQFAFEFAENGKFRLRGATDNWFALLREIAELLASDTLVIAYGSSAGSGHALEHQAQYAEIRDKLAGMEL